MKSRKRILLGIVAIFILLNIIEGFTEIDQNKLNISIDSYFNNESKDTEEGKVKIFSYKQLGNKKFGVLIEQYSLIGSTLHYIHSNSEEISIYPVKFKIISFFGFNKVISCDSVSYKNENGDINTEIFPQDIIYKLDKNYNDYVNELKTENKDKINKVEESTDW